METVAPEPMSENKNKTTFKNTLKILHFVFFYMECLIWVIVSAIPVPSALFIDNTFDYSLKIAPSNDAIFIIISNRDILFCIKKNNNNVPILIHIFKITIRRENVIITFLKSLVY